MTDGVGRQAEKNLEGVIEFLSGNEVDDLDEDGERPISRDHSTAATREQTVADALQTAIGRRVALALDPDHVHPATRGHPR